ncbi:MAG TPA: 4Fe-4S dicluster domain-containing protein [Desulfohalobiaceae bacterium]|nr:4Fe-4S dicluster domain-containing protein [Desulfohalobiaceae bacterium]
MPRYGLYIDVFKCIGCYGCLTACKNWHGIPAGEQGRRRLVDVTEGDYPLISRWIFPVSCMHCDEPLCTSVCPTEATFKRYDGIVVIDQEKCIGCGECVESCPYNARTMRAGIEKADGCDMCVDRLDQGLLPYCVTSCAGEAMAFGDLDDPGSRIVKLIEESNAQQLAADYGRHPKIFYANLHMQTNPEDVLA